MRSMDVPMSYELSPAPEQALAPSWQHSADRIGRSEAPIPQVGSVRSAIARGRGALTAVRDMLGARPPEHADATAGLECDAASDAAARTTHWLLDRQAIDGHWRGPLEGDSILESEYLLILAWAGRTSDPHAPGACRRILAEQRPGGGWAIHPGGPVDVSASVKAYLALKVFGHDPHSEPLERARAAIAAAGGPWAVNSFTRYYLALLGQIPYSACPAVPPEMVLLPDWFPVNLARVSAWSRTMIVPLSLMWAFQPVRRIPVERGIAELFSRADARHGPPPAGGRSGWASFFKGVDRILKLLDSLGIRPLRSRAVMACRRWMLDRFSGSDGLGAIFPPIVWSIVALKALGCDDDSPEVAECWRQLGRLVEPQPDGTTRLEPCRSPVWDTAISLRGLADAAGTAGGPGRSGEAARLAAAVDWLLDREVRAPGDWERSAARARPSGWCFQYANRFYPDVDDTAMVLIALATWRDHAGGPAAATEAGRRRLARNAAAFARAVPWLEAMQNSDGGWGAFDRDNDCELLCQVPFADHNAMIDPSSPDLAGRVLEAFGRLGLRQGHPAVDRGVAYLRREQRPDGSWFGRWGVNYIYGTWQAIEGLGAVGVSADDPAVSCGADWLASRQQPCGGWGESCESYADERLAGVGTPTASQTAWALAGLVAAGRPHCREARRGAQWLVARQAEDGAWDEREFTGTGFPKVFYLRYHYYPIYFPLMALARWAAARRSAAGGSVARGRVA
ncbi:MAG: squalene--hopene cyclase [Planctomycetia bacterium]|nr:squalene--hopene cyclase [Planctomycetia bacterium]